MLCKSPSIQFGSEYAHFVYTVQMKFYIMMIHGQARKQTLITLRSYPILAAYYTI